MFISDFTAGFFLGAIIAIVGIVVLCLHLDKKEKK
jgi:hypothetical protein